MRKESLQFLEDLLNTPSPSGFEARGQKLWLRYVAAFAQKTGSDAYGNAFAVLNEGGSPKVMIAGHADEIGFMVHFINEEGFLYGAAIGGPDVALARGQRVVVHTRQGPVPGVTGSLAIHMQDRQADGKPPRIHDIFIDIGAKDGKEARRLVSVGDPVTYADQFQLLRGGRAVARGCDNRIGTFAAAEVIRVLQGSRKLKACVLAVSNVQEENGLYGAHMTSYSLRPDLALIVDVGQATDIPVCSKPKHGDQRLGKGPILGIGSSNHPVIVDRLRQVARKKGVPVQMSVDPSRTGTDADAVFLSRGGIPTATVCLPNRYMHTPVEMIHLDDLENIVTLVAEFCESLQPGETFKVEI